MARNVNIGYFFINNVGALSVEVVDDLTDSSFIAGNEFRRKYVLTICSVRESVYLVVVNFE